MALTFTSFTPGAPVALHRPQATPGIPPPTEITTVSAGADGKATFADQTAGHYLAVATGRSVWQIVNPGYDNTLLIVPPW